MRLTLKGILAHAAANNACASGLDAVRRCRTLDELKALVAAPEYAYWYAGTFAKRHPEVEAVIARDPHTARCYATAHLHARWPAGEAAIATTAQDSYYYAQVVIRGAWPPGEAAIATSRVWCGLYNERFDCDIKYIGDT